MRAILAVAIGASVCAACGDDGATSRDAGSHDGALADSVDAPPLPVSVTFTSAGAPVVGATVYFLNADDSLVTEAMTDTNGSASHVMAAGGSVTVIASEPNPNPIATTALFTIQTIAGVKPGDRLAITGAPALGAPITIHVTTPLVDDATGYFLDTTCGSAQLEGGSLDALGVGATNVTDVMLAGCNGVADMVVTASFPVVSAYSPSVAVTDGATIALTTTYTPIATATATYTDAVGVTEIDFDQRFITAHGQLSETATQAPPSNGAVTIMLQQPVIPNALALDETTLQSDGPVDNQVFETTTNATSYALDVNATLLPQIIAAPVFNPAAHDVTWTEAIGGVTPLAATATIDGSRTADSIAWSWSVVQARDGQSVVFPVLPTDVHDFNASATDSIAIDSLTLLAPPGNYDTVRPVWFAIDDPSALVTAAIGRAVVETYSAPREFSRTRAHTHAMLRASHITRGAR